MSSKKFALLKKITLSEVFGLTRASGGFKPKAHFGADENGNFAPHLIMRVIGLVHGYSLGTTNYGDFYKFSGNFAAINADGEEFRSPICIVPSPADELLKNAVDSANGSPVQMAFDIHAVQDSGDRGYKFQITPLMQQEQGDPLDALMQTTAENFQLPAPRQATLPGTEAEAAPEQAPPAKGKAK